MKGFLTILEGADKGGQRPLTSALVIVGRSKNADLQIEDPLVSRRHLEIRTEADGVFVENKSTQGAYLNSKPLVGIVSLNAGDVIQIGDTKLRFDEIAAGLSPSVEPLSSEPVSSALDGTRIADSKVELQRQKKEAPAPEETRAMVEDGTRMLNPSELPNWVAQKKVESKAPGKNAALLWLLVIMVAGLGGLYWFMRGNRQVAPQGMIEYKDSLYGFDLQRPLDWVKLKDEANFISFGFGKESERDSGSLNIYTDKSQMHELTGLTDGFVGYEQILKSRYKDFELIGSKLIHINNATVIFYGFSSPAMQGKGIYTLNGDTRIVVECVSPVSSYQNYAHTYGSLLQGFHLSDFDPQQFIDFPLPDEGMQQLALANPSELARQVDEHARQGEMFLNNPYVKPDNLYNAVHEFQKALQLAKAAAHDLPAYQSIAARLGQATKLFNQTLDRERFEISRAQKDGDTTTAYWEANKMMQMVPDKIDPAYQEAYRIVRATAPHGR